MGRMIEAWMQEELPKLQMLLAPPSNMGDPGIDQGNGVRTFPVAVGPQGPPQGPTFGQGPQGPPEPQGPGLPANWRAQIPRSPQAQRFAQQQRGAPTNAASTFEPPPQREAPKFEDIETFDDLVAAAPEQTAAGVDILTQHLGGEEGVDRAYTQATGRPPPQGLSRQEKGQLLMEFGLRVLAHNAQGQGDSLGAIGQAGVETLVGHRERQRQKVTDAQEEEDRKLRRELMEAQVAKAKADRTQLKADRDGKLRLINMDDGTSRMVLDEKGNPVESGGEGDDQFVFDLQRNAFEGAFCSGLEGRALAECKQNALLFSKGGSIAELAFPEIRRQKRVDELMKFYADPDNSGVRLRTGDGTMKRWREMSGDEQREAVLRYVDQFDTALTGRATGARSAPPARENNWGLTQEQIASFPEGKRTTLPNGVRLAKRGGRIYQVDEQGNEIQ